MKRKLGEMEFASAEAAASQMASSSTRRESQLEHSSTSHHSLSPSPADDAEAENRIACAHCPSTFSDVQEWFEHCKVHPWSVQFMDLPSNESPSAAPSASPNTTVTATQQPTKVSKPSRRIQKRQKWESIKEEVHHLYFVKGMTLQATMTEIESKYSFKASLRRWKMQMKAWSFEKNLSKQDMCILVAKSNKRAREEGKETTFYCRGQQISPEKMVAFKKRKLGHEMVVSPSAETPMAITYETPRHETGLEEDKSGDGGNLATVRNEKAVESRERSSQSARYALNAQNAQIALVAPVERPESASWTKITTDVLWKEWLEHETAKNLERSDPLRRLGFQLEMAESLLDLDFALTQELLLSAVFEYLSDVTIPSEHRLRSTPEQKLASKTSYDWMLPWDYSLFRLPAELQKRIWREYTNRLRTHLQMRLDGIRAENEDTLVLGSLDNDDFNLITMGMLAKIVLLCAKRAGENEVQMVLREIITKANSCQGTQAEIVSAYAQLCYAMHCVWRSGGKSSRALAEYEASIRKIIEKMEHCEQRVRLVRLYNTVRQTINVLALTPEALGT